MFSSKSLVTIFWLSIVPVQAVNAAEWAYEEAVDVQYNRIVNWAVSPSSHHRDSVSKIIVSCYKKDLRFLRFVFTGFKPVKGKKINEETTIYNTMVGFDGGELTTSKMFTLSYIDGMSVEGTRFSGTFHSESPSEILNKILLHKTMTLNFENYGGNIVSHTYDTAGAAAAIDSIMSECGK